MTKKNLVLAAFIAAVVVLVDQLSKIWALTALSDGQTIPVIGDFISLHLVFNPGAAFSFLDNATWVFTILGTIFVVGALFFIRRLHTASLLYTAAVIWGGALGNLIDRFVRPPGFARGHVIDFIQYSDWFIGNIADIALVAGFGVLILIEIIKADTAPTLTEDTEQE
ncbi:signal peptidase II [Arcanobacterium phocae]|uniref:signal peptidase II n=1 Tax=Arcanobacterium phocae TaxID=131112 RepID=UPI0027E20962|nr:signal peptidase II [Arcanobacterium phocae]